MPSSESFCGLHHRIAIGLEMLDITDVLRPALARLEQRIQPRLALGQRQAAQVKAIGKQQVEREEDQAVGLAVGNRSLQVRKIRRAVVIERDDLAVDQRVRQCAAFARDR